MPRFARLSHAAQMPVVTAVYLLAALLMTWPLAAVLSREIAGDRGDTLFNCWVLLWTSGQVLRALGGDLPALADYWNGNIFYPAPLTLAYSEHLTPQMLQALPILAASGNIVLAYNLLFLSTIVLSGLGMFLLVRELTGQPLAAFVAGLAFAFAPYRIDQYAHIQVLSSQWMPFALFGFRRFFVTGRLRPLAAGAVALLAQALSCGYYLAYFTPFAVAYCLYEMAARRKLADGRTWRALIVAGAAVIVVLAIFLAPYGRVRRSGDVGVRGGDEVHRYSADTHAFATASENSRVWGSRVRAFPREQGQGFPGFAIGGFAALAVAAGGIGAVRRARHDGSRAGGPRRLLAAGLTAVLLALALMLGHILVTGRGMFALGWLVLRYSPLRLLAEIAAVVAVLLAVSPRFRRVARGTPGSPIAFFAGATVAAAWMSLGPVMHANGREIGPGLYALLYRWVPAFNGLRVVSLNFMLVALFLAVLAGLGAAALLRRWPAAGRAIVAAGSIAILAESASTSIVTTVPAPGPIYAVVRTLPAGTVLAEFPFGDVTAEIEHTFFAGLHRKPIVNGYSGFFPEHYVTLVGWFASTPAGAQPWQALLASGATHAIVHERAYAGEGGRAVSEWLRGSGAAEVGALAGDRLFALRR